MNTRSGSVDPGLVLWLINQAGLDPAEVADGRQRRSGLAGLSDTSGDLREIGAGRLAFDLHVHRLCRDGCRPRVGWTPWCSSARKDVEIARQVRQALTAR